MKAGDVISELKRYELGPYIEVPCSYLDTLIDALTHDKQCEVLNPANEAIAMGLAAGSYLATNRIPVVLIQNSGLCNTLNALTSLNKIYKIPVLYLISWRGQPNTRDEPEHEFMGSKLQEILTTFEVPNLILAENAYKEQIKSIFQQISASKQPGALLITKGLIEKVGQKGNREDAERKIELSRAEAVNIIVNAMGDMACYVTTNGYISREACYALGKNGLGDKCPCFYMLGSMGHALPIALGIAKHSKADRKIVALDGDGGCIMHLGAMASVGKENGESLNLIHIVLDNGVYASTGSQPTLSANIDLLKIARGCGYKEAFRVKDAQSLNRVLAKSLKFKGPSFIQVRIKDDGESPKPRVSERYSCEDIKQSFMSAMTAEESTIRTN